MQVLIADALPPASVARELAGLLPQRAPVFDAWLRRARARVETLDVAALGCTPTEVWQLRRAGFAPDNPQRVSATLGSGLCSGLGPLRAHIQTGNEPVWLADLVHLALGAQHAALACGRDLDVSEAEDQALFDAALPAVPESGFTLARLAPGRWRVGWPDGLRPDLNPPGISPAAASRGHLEHCWPQDPASRPWRRLLNDIQMIWHDHPVNLARSQRGQPVINGLWLYGGARPWTFAASAPARVCDELAPHAAAGDWAAWLDALEALDRDILATLLPSPSPARGRGEQNTHRAPALILTDHTRLVTLTPASRFTRGWLARLPSHWFSHSPHWTSWWHPHA